MAGLQDGAIAMLDALGVKGIWNGPQGENTDALAMLHAALRTAEQMGDYIRNGVIPKAFKPHFGFEPIVSMVALSDTLVIGAQAPATSAGKQNEATQAALVDVVRQGAGYVLRKAAQGTPPLVYRGVVTVGRFIIEKSFLLGLQWTKPRHCMKRPMARSSGLRRGQRVYRGQATADPTFGRR